MGDLRSAAWLVLVAGCTAPAPLTLVAISPSDVPLHGGDVELTFDGEMPAESIYVNGIAAALDGHTLHVPPTPGGIGPLALRVGDDADRPFATLERAGRYVEAADSVALSQTPAGLAVPLHPELAHDCARAGVVTVANTGDAAFVISPELTGSPAFATYFPPDECPLPMFHDSCNLLMCFSSTVTDTHSAHLEVPSTAITASLDFTATVLPPTPGLDVALWRPYSTQANEPVRGLTTLPGGAVAVWDESPAISFDIVAPDGTWTRHATGGLNVSTMRAGAAGQGIYAIASGSLIHFADNGARDLAFTPIALPPDASALQVDASGALVITATKVITSSTTLDFAAYGTFTGASALDTTGALYLATTSGVIRFVNGTVDPGFLYAAKVTALAPPLVASGTTLGRLDGTLLAQLPRPIVDLAAGFAVTDDGQLVHLTAAGQPDGARGFDGALHVACPATGDCAAIGLANGLDKYLVELAP
jgi:hypothetical protein